MRRTLALVLAVPVLWAAPSIASAQSAQPYDPRVQPYDQRAQPYGQRWSQPPWWGGGEEEEVAATAHRLSEFAARLHRSVRGMQGYSQLANDTLQLARTAERFHVIVESRAPYPRVMQAFADLQRDYYELRSAFFREHRTHHIEGIVNEWTRLVTSFERLALAIGIEEEQLCDIGPHRPDERYGSYDPRFDDPRLGRVPPGQRGLRFQSP